MRGWRGGRGPAGPPGPARPGVITLADLEEGSEAVVRNVVAGYGAAGRLAEMGITPGAIVKVVRRGLAAGPIEVEVGGARFLIGLGMASKVVVEPLRRSRLP